MKAGILSLGCKVNTYESEFVTNKLKDAGYEIVSFNDFCDVYIINTCTVTNTADIKSKKMIRNAIKKNPNAIVVAMGCFIAANQKFDIEGLDIVIGNKDKSRIVEIIEEYKKNKKQIRLDYTNTLDEFEDMAIDKFPGRTRAFVKIQDGCENFCTYCIIPYVRGKCRSKDKTTVLEEVNSLVESGYQEIVLTGIHTGNYGCDKDYDFADLLSELVKIKGLKRIRISSIEVCELNDKVLKLLKDNNIIVDHLHIPLQAGSDAVLKAMNRRYDLAYFFDKIEKIREIRPNISITTDVIVGFPTETREDFLKTIKTVKALEFAKIHVFPFSLRNGTKAEEFENIVSPEEKKQRARELLDVSKELELSYFNKFVGKEEEVLIEQYKDGYSYGHTSNFLYVKIPKKLEHNTFYKTTIKEVNYPYCIGD